MPAPKPAAPPLSPEDLCALRTFVNYALGDEHLTVWEENFVNNLKHKLFRPVTRLSTRELVKIDQIKAKLHYNRPEVPLPKIDPDGVEVNEDPDGWPIEEEIIDEFNKVLLVELA